MITNSLKEYLLSRINKQHGCWLWTGSLFKDGYGSASFKNKTIRAHRASYELFVGKLSPDLDVHHTCNNKLCINPKHLRLVTRKQHHKMSVAATKTHCKHGHVFDVTNTYRNKTTGRRACRACHRRWSKQWTKRNREAL